MKNYNAKQIVSLSGGKDSTAMLHAMLERGERIDEVVFFDTGWEFPEMYDHIELVEQKTGIVITRLHTDKPFEHYLTDKPFGEKSKYYSLNSPGYGYPSFLRRWCTKLKTNELDKYRRKCGDFISCVGIAYDESRRIKNDAKIRYPLNEYEMTEADCLNLCYSLGYDWGGLYRWNHRVSCYCCPLQPNQSLYELWKRRPELWDTLRSWKKKIDANVVPGLERKGLFKNDKTIFEIEAEFEQRLAREKTQRLLF